MSYRRIAILAAKSFSANRIFLNYGGAKRS